MYRDILNKLNDWKQSRRRKPLLITGVRQCGKTYVIKEFGRNSFENMVYINFESDEHFAEIFDYNFDTERIIKEIEVARKEKIIPGKTLLVFDEIQECPRAITSLKYFCEEMRDLHLVCAGSLLGVAIKAENVSFPVGKINRLRMFPMNFREFVTACGGSSFIDALSNWPISRPVPDLYRIPMESFLKDYYLVGGMPEAVNEWIISHDLKEVEAVQDEILKDYADDFSKHAPKTEVEKIRWIWDSVPNQLAKDNNKFMFSHVKEGKRAADLEAALTWLSDAGLVTKLEMVENVELPLSACADATFFKVYMSDIGLLRRKAGLPESFYDGAPELFSRFKGALTENFVLNELLSLGISLYYWRSGNTAEVDFIYEEDGHVIPAEVKSADNVQAKSIRIFCRKYHPEKGFKLSLKNIAENSCENTRMINLPLYMIWGKDNLSV